jgi:O-antigen/teichoic acid export membrane protein
VIALGVGGLMAGAGAVFLLIGAPGLRSFVRGPLWLYLLPLATLPVLLLVQYWQAILRGMNHIRLISVVDVGSKLVALVLVVGFVVGLRLDIAGAVWADVIMTIGFAILMVGLLRHVGLWGRPALDWSLACATTRFALPAHAGTVASYLNYRVDQLIIAAWLPPEQLAFYVIAVGFAERVWVPTGAVATALLPHLTNMGKRDPALSAMIARHVMLWTGAACMFVFVFADVIVTALFSTAYAPAAAPLRWLLPGIVTLSVGKILVAEMFAREKVRYTVWASGIAALVNAAGNLVLVPRMGITGSAIASSFSYSLLAFIGTWYFLRETGLPWSVLMPRPSDLTIYATFWTRGRRVPASEAAWL